MQFFFKRQKKVRKLVRARVRTVDPRLHMAVASLIEGLCKEQQLHDEVMLMTAKLSQLRKKGNCNIARMLQHLMKLQ